MSNPETESNRYPLPVVSDVTAETAAEDYSSDVTEDYAIRALDRMAQFNPSATASLLGFIDGHGRNSDEKGLAMLAVCVFHEMLVKQAAGEEMDRQFNQ